MATRVKWVRYGRPAALALHEAITSAKGDEPLAPVSVVVPSNHVGVAARRLLGSGELGPLCGSGTGVVAVTFLTVFRMAELLGSSALAGQKRRPVSTPVLAAAIRQALARNPGVFAPVAHHPATELALVSSYKELRDVSAEGLDLLAKCGRRAGDVVRLYRDARDRLAPSWYDEEDLINGTVEVLDAETLRRSGLGAIVVYLPQRLSRHGARLLDKVAELSDLTILAGMTGDQRADGDVQRSMSRLGTVVESEPPPSVDSLEIVSSEKTRIVTTSDADEEARAAVRAVVDAARAGATLDRIAILYARPEPYGRLVHDHLASAGIAHNGASVVPLTARLAGRTLLGLLDLQRTGFRREDVFAWLAGARLHDRGKAVPVTAWERLSRDAGVVAGGNWDKLLATYAADMDARAERAEADPDAPSWRAESLRTDAERARGLRDFILGLKADIDAQEVSPRSWAERSAWARNSLNDLLGGERQRTIWPLHEQKAAERVERALDRLAGLASVEPAVSLEVFARTLELELEADLGRVGRIGEGVLIGSLRMGVGLDLDLVVILGLTEGSCPSPTREDSLLPDNERQALGDELVLRSEGVERQHQEVLASLAGASHHLLCVARGDLRHSTERIPSRWALDIASALAGRRLWSEDLLALDAPWLHHVASFDAGLRELDFPASEQEYRLRSLMAKEALRAKGTPAQSLGDAVLSNGIDMVKARRSPAFTRFDGNLAGLPIPSPVERTTSATRFEGWAVCPFAYLVKSILDVPEVENPEDRLQISPMDQGSLVHQVLEDFIDDVLGRPAALQPAPSEAWSESDRTLMMSIAEKVCDYYESHGKTGRPIFWQRDRRRIMNDLERFLVADSAHRAAHGTKPVAAELGFGMPGSVLEAVALALPDGRSVRFRGKADRMDVSVDGTAHIVDYKTGAARYYAGLSELEPDAKGTKLQLPVYGQAARLHLGNPAAEVIAEYWFVSRKGDFKRSGYRVTAEVIERVGETLQKMVTGIENGVFPNHPTTNSTNTRVECAYCDPDALGVVDLLRRIGRKRSDPALGPFLALVAPADSADGDAEVDDA